MAHFSGDDLSQLLLLPESVDDYVGQDNVVRFIDAFFDGLDMQAAGFGRVQPKPTGIRPGRSAEVFSPGNWWIGSMMNLSGSEVQILQMYS